MREDWPAGQVGDKAARGLWDWESDCTVICRLQQQQQQQRGQLAAQRGIGSPRQCQSRSARRAGRWSSLRPGRRSRRGAPPAHRGRLCLHTSRLPLAVRHPLHRKEPGNCSRAPHCHPPRPPRSPLAAQACHVHLGMPPRRNQYVPASSPAEAPLQHHRRASLRRHLGHAPQRLVSAAHGLLYALRRTLVDLQGHAASMARRPSIIPGRREPRADARSQHGVVGGNLRLPVQVDHPAILGPPMVRGEVKGKSKGCVQRAAGEKGLPLAGIDPAVPRTGRVFTGTPHPSSRGGCASGKLHAHSNGTSYTVVSYR